MRRTAHGCVFLIAFAAASGAATPCPKTVDLAAGAKLEDLATQYFGKAGYSISIALATNARGSEGFRYIANPDNLTGIPKVCIPANGEARELERSWAAYDRAVTAARLPRGNDINKNLVTITADQPVSVVAWVRKDQADRLKVSTGGWVTTAQSDMWVTVEPHLKEFCSKFAREHKADGARLTQRLEQRLGLSPVSSKTTFVRMKLEHPGADVIFRPCSDPVVTQANCATGPPAASPPEYPQWFLQQYYYSYGNSLISEFPWTALGYTFDWAPARGRGFQRVGESEFVVRKGSPIEIQEAVATADYCAAHIP